MENGQIITDDGEQRVYLNGAYFIYEPIKGSIDNLVKKAIKTDIRSLYDVCLLLKN